MIELTYPPCFEEEYLEVTAWCADNFGERGSHEYRNNEIVLLGRWSCLYASLASANALWRYSSWYYFRDEADASLFTLRWL